MAKAKLPKGVRKELDELFADIAYAEEHMMFAEEAVTRLLRSRTRLKDALENEPADDVPQNGTGLPRCERCGNTAEGLRGKRCPKCNGEMKPEEA